MFSLPVYNSTCVCMSEQLLGTKSGDYFQICQKIVLTLKLCPLSDYAYIRNVDVRKNDRTHIEPRLFSFLASIPKNLIRVRRCTPKPSGRLELF